MAYCLWCARRAVASTDISKAYPTEPNGKVPIRPKGTFPNRTIPPAGHSRSETVTPECLAFGAITVLCRRWAMELALRLSVEKFKTSCAPPRRGRPESWCGCSLTNLIMACVEVQVVFALDPASSAGPQLAQPVRCGRCRRRCCAEKARLPRDRGFRQRSEGCDLGRNSGVDQPQRVFSR